MLKEKLKIEGLNLEFTKLAGAYYAYLFHRWHQRQFVDYVGDKKVARALIRRLKYDGYVHMNCKVYAWAWHLHRLGGPKPSYKDYGVVLEDARFLRRLNLNHLDSKHRSYSVSELQTVLNTQLGSSHMKEHIGKLISKKMMFLINSYGVDREELEAELKAEALRAVYRQYPRFHSELHMLNTAKTTIHNTAMSKIKYYTCASRQRLFQDEQGAFQAVHSDISLVGNKIAGPDQYLSHIKDQLATIVALGPKMKPEVQGFLAVLAGQPDRGFTQFLGRDNTEAVERMTYERYAGKAAQYYGLTEKRVARIFTLLRNHLQ